MPKMVVDGAKVRCSMGSIPSVLLVSDESPISADDKPVATVNDHVPKRNLVTFGMCRSEQNPQVSSATAAALGTLTPQPCIPMTMEAWSPGAPMAVSKDVNILTNESTCKCKWAGTIEVLDANNDVEIAL